LEQYIASSLNHILDCSNIVKTNLQAHKWNGIALCTCTLIHVWSILFPCLTHQWKAQILLGSFEYPLSERTPDGFSDVNVKTKTMSLQGDDVFRMIEMTLLLGILTPLSIYWMQYYWHLGIHVHRFITIIYFVDIVRRHSHPHSWILNTPIFTIWIIDKFYSLYWRQIKNPHFIRQIISQDYIVLYWKDEHDINVIKNDKKDEETPSDSFVVGTNYLIKAYPSSWMEDRHKFTVFQNRHGNCNFLFNEMMNNESFSNGVVIRIFHHDRRPHIGTMTEVRSHTERFLNIRSPTDGLSIWGPFQGKMTKLIPNKLCNIRNDRSVVLVGSGSAINFMIDLMSLLCCPKYNEYIQKLSLSKTQNVIMRKEIVLLYSTRDVALYDWVHNTMTLLLTSLLLSKEEVEEKGGRRGLGSNHISKPNIRIVLACTCKKHHRRNKPIIDELDTKTTIQSLVDSNLLVQTTDEEVSFGNEYIQTLDERIDYKHAIPNNCDVFCQGSLEFKEVIEEACHSKENIHVFFD